MVSVINASKQLTVGWKIMSLEKVALKLGNLRN
jgi:hypothetical protein